MNVVILTVLVYNIITFTTFKDYLRRFGLLKNTRRDFYECGFKPQTQRPIKISIQFLMICIFFIIYDIELIFLIPFISGLSFLGLYESALLVFFFSVFFSSLIFDYDRHVLAWQL